MRSSSLQSASTAASIDGGTWRSSSSSRWIAKRLSSAWSSSTIRCGSDARDLAAQLRADRAAGAGHEHGLPRQVGADALELHVHRLAAEHVLDAHLAHLAGERAARLQQLEHGRQRAHRDAARAALAHDPRAGRARRGGDRDDHFVGLGLVEDARQVRLRCCRARARRRSAGRRLRGSSSRKPTGASPSSRLRMISRSDHPPALAGAGDQHACARPCARRGTRPAGGARRRCARARARRRGTRSESSANRTITPLGRTIATLRGDRVVAAGAGSGAPGGAPRWRRPSAARSRRPRATTAS